VLGADRIAGTPGQSVEEKLKLCHPTQKIDARKKRSKPAIHMKQQKLVILAENSWWMSTMNIEQAPLQKEEHR
jgi:ribosomal protein L30E